MRGVASRHFARLLWSALAGVAPPAWAQTIEQPRTVIGDNATAESDTDLAKQIQNPVGELISFPLQDNVNFGYGPHKGIQNVLDLQPVVPFHLSDDWNLITRTILPIVWNPCSSSFPLAQFGPAPTSFTAFLPPSHDINGWLWGAGALLNNVWSLGGTHGATTTTVSRPTPSSPTTPTTGGISPPARASLRTGKSAGPSGRSPSAAAEDECFASARSQSICRSASITAP